MSLLFTPLTLRGVELRNRLWVSPMGINSTPDGAPNDWHHVHLAQFASGGAGLVFTEASAVLPEGRIAPLDAGLWNDLQRDAWKPIVAAIHARGGAAGVQLNHSGRKGSLWWPFAGRGTGSVPLDEDGWVTYGPSAVAYQGYAEPAALGSAEIDRIVEAFAASARRAREAGFDVVEIHAAHGYLVHQFLSPLSNLRDDEYGGSLENRARLLLRVVHAVRNAVGESIPVFVRFSGTDWAEGGWDIDETSVVASWAAEKGADLFDLSSGGLVAHQEIPVTPGYQVPLAAEVRRRTGMPVAAVGLITDGPQAEAILESGAADAVFVAREWLRNPHLALHAAQELGEDPTDLWPHQYLPARKR